MKFDSGDRVKINRVSSKIVGIIVVPGTRRSMVYIAKCGTWMFKNKDLKKVKGG